MTDRPEKPAYQQVAENLRARIRDGQYPVGSQLPSLSALMAQYSASITVIRMALRELRSSDIISTRQGEGAFVLAVPTDSDDARPSTELQAVMRHLDLLQDLVERLDHRLAALEQTVGRSDPRGEQPPPQDES